MAGLSAIHDWQIFMNTGLFLACWPSWFASRSKAWPDKVHYLGFLRSDDAETGNLPEQVLSLLSEPEGIILISGGTAIATESRRFYQTCMEGCHLVGRKALLVCRYRELVPEVLLPGTAYFERLPFASLIPHVSCVVHHGGTSLLVRALLEGKPQIALPFGGDRPDTALRLQKLGVCLRLPRNEWSPEAVAKSIQTVHLSPAIAEACAEARLKMDSSEDLRNSCEVIEDSAMTL